MLLTDWPYIEGSMTPSAGSVNFLEQFTKHRETLTCIYQFVIKDTDEQPDEEVYGVRSVKIPSTRASILMELGVPPSGRWKNSELCPSGFL